MKLIIAIYGASSVGKTTIAREVCTILNVPVRHCGDALKARAKELRIDADSFPIEEHKRIDEETRELAKACTGIIVIEGRFLLYVLEKTDRVLFVHLTCSDEERRRRFFGRHGILPPSAFGKEDEITAELRRQLYDEGSPKPANNLTIVTDGRGVTETANEIAQRAREFLKNTA